MYFIWKKILPYGLSVLMLCFGLVTYGQDEEVEDNECVRTLAKAQKAYDDGLIEKIDQMLLPCLQSEQLSNDEKQQGYRLLAMAKLYDGKDQEAEEAMLAFLKIDPEYQLQPGVDPKEFSELYGNYHTSPLYTIGLFMGPNFAMAKPYKEYGAYNTSTDKKEYKSNVGFQVGFRVTRYIYKGLNVHLDLGFMQSGFTYTQDILESYTNVDLTDPTPSSPTKGVTIESRENQSSLILPLTFSYTFLEQKQIRPYAIVGFETRFLLSASNSLLKTYFDQDIAAVEVAEVEGFKDSRNSLSFSGIFGAGAKLKIPRGDIFLEGKYNLGISDQVKRDEVPVNEDVRLWNFYQADNDFTLDNLMFNVGYTYYLYKPRKMKAQKAPDLEKEAKSQKNKEEKSSDESGKEEKKENDDSGEKNPTKKRQVIE